MHSAPQLVIVLLCLILAGCTNTFPTDKIDPAGNLTREDYLSLRNRGKATEQDLNDNRADTKAVLQSLHTAPPIPPLPMPAQPILLGRDEPLPSKKISVTLTESVALRDVLIELGRESGVNLEIDPRIHGGIIFTAKNQPFNTVLQRICLLAGLRYTVDGDFIRIELDEPYQQTYALDYLSLSRRTTSEVTIATNVFDVDVAGSNGGSSSSSSSRGNGGSDNNSVAKITGAADADFWSEVEKSIPQVLATANRRKSMIVGRPEATDPKQQDANFSLDKQAGLITIFGNGLQQRAVKHYLERLQNKASAQVLIEARIVEVELSDEFQSGINWTSIFSDTLSLAADFGAPGAGAAMTAASSGLFSTALDTGDFSGILKLVRTFGTTRVLSSPRLTVMNNQTAVLKVARNEVYFLTSAQFPTTTNSNGVAVSGTPVFSSTPRTVPVGLVMTVQPAINSDTGRVTMTLRPTISRVVDRVNDPSIGLNAAYSGNSATVQSQIPVLAVREMDSVLQLQSGEVAVMGGLMQDSSENQDQGVPPFDTFPLVGNLAKSRDNQGRTSELVILLRATILSNPRPDAADANLYEKYNRDPRPFEIPET
ncbi:MAG: secretin N-terminal domain-containing protein [Alphaproteobacteria bacterium]|nr:secretin N-terminal domain-containing protein [Alphaproteobacteria bacterium]